MPHILGIDHVAFTAQDLASGVIDRIHDSYGRLENQSAAATSAATRSRYSP